MSFRNFNSGLQYDFSKMSLNTAPIFRSQTPSSVHWTPSEVSAIPCVLFGNTLRALFFKNRDFFLLRRNNPVYTRGPLGCLLGFWPSGPKPCGGNYNLPNAERRTPNVGQRYIMWNVYFCEHSVCPSHELIFHAKFYRKKQQKQLNLRKASCKCHRKL